MFDEFKNKVALVTGGNSGMGKETALKFAKNGAKVIIAGRNSKKGHDTINEIKSNNGIGLFVKTDVSKPDEVEKLIQTTIETFGSIDFVFNNAGIDGETAKTVDCSLENWHNVINVNLNSVFYCLKYQIRQMLKQGSGVIVNNSSVSGLRGYPTAPAYISSKHGVIGLTKAAALEYAAEGIRINAICPGLIYTPMLSDDYDNNEDYRNWCKRITPMKRIGKSSEIADTVLWLCSEKSSFITGQAIVVDGGILIR